MIGWFRRSPYERQVLVVYIVAIFVTVIDGTMVNVALPTMAEEFGVRSSDVEWVAVGYLLAVATVIPAAGWLGDRLGTARVFSWSLALFTVVSVLCGLSGTLDQLVALRVLQGLGGGLMTPIGAAILYRAFPMNRRATAATAVLSVAVVAPAAGPLLGGLLVDQASWRWIFLINLPIGLVGLTLAALSRRDDPPVEPGRLDLFGLLGTGASIAVVLYTVSIAPDSGWTSPEVIGLGIAGGIGLAATVVHELRIDQPALRLRLFRDHLFRTVNISAALIYAGFFGHIFVVPIYMQSLRGYSAFESGLSAAPQAVGVLVMSILFGDRAYRMIGPRRLMVVGTAVTAVVTGMFATVDLSTPLGVVAAMSFVRGLAVGLVFVSIQTAVYATTSLAETGRATSLFNTQRQISYAVGTAIAATVLAAVLGGLDESAPAAERLSAHRWAFLAVAAVMVPAVFVASRLRDADVAETRGLAMSES